MDPGRRGRGQQHSRKAWTSCFEPLMATTRTPAKGPRLRPHWYSRSWKSVWTDNHQGRRITSEEGGTRFRVTSAAPCDGRAGEPSTSREANTWHMFTVVEAKPLSDLHYDAPAGAPNQSPGRQKPARCRKPRLHHPSFDMVIGDLRLPGRPGTRLIKARRGIRC